jgi:hypothetical protein
MKMKIKEDIKKELQEALSEATNTLDFNTIKSIMTNHDLVNMELDINDNLLKLLKDYGNPIVVDIFNYYIDYILKNYIDAKKSNILEGIFFEGLKYEKLYVVEKLLPLQANRTEALKEGFLFACKYGNISVFEFLLHADKQTNKVKNMFFCFHKSLDYMKSGLFGSSLLMRKILNDVDFESVATILMTKTASLRWIIENDHKLIVDVLKNEHSLKVINKMYSETELLKKLMQSNSGNYYEKGISKAIECFIEIYDILEIMKNVDNKIFKEITPEIKLFLEKISLKDKLGETLVNNDLVVNTSIKKNKV